MASQGIDRALRILYGILDDADRLALGRKTRLRVVAAIGELEDARAGNGEGRHPEPEPFEPDVKPDDPYG